jgi:hypothetical protein
MSSMSNKKVTIGFDRYIEKQWIDQTAKWVVQGKPRAELHTLIDDYLSPFIKGETSLRKTKNVLFGCWVNETEKNQPFKQQARDLWKQVKPEERLMIHWGLAMASYPYFASVVRQIGRLNRLQGDIHSKELQKRMVENHGDTESVRRAASRLLQSLTQWGVLEQLNTSTFHVKSSPASTDRKLLSWLAVSPLLCSDRARLDVAEIYSDPAFFPFEIDNQLMKPETNMMVEVVHQGVSETVISLKISRN